MAENMILKASTQEMRDVSVNMRNEYLKLNTLLAEIHGQALKLTSDWKGRCSVLYQKHMKDAEKNSETLKKYIQESVDDLDAIIVLYENAETQVKMKNEALPVDNVFRD